MMKVIIIWFFRIAITFVPVLFSNLAAAYNFAHMGKKSFLDLLSDGQICFLACSIAASSIVNLLEAFVDKKLTLFSALVFFVLLMIALLSIVFYFFFKGVFNTKDATSEADIARWTRYRNRSVVAILVVVLVFSFIADVGLG